MLLLALTLACSDAVGPDKTVDSDPVADDSGLPPLDTDPVNEAPGVAFLDPRPGEVFTPDQEIRVEVLAGEHRSPGGTLESEGEARLELRVQAHRGT